MARHTQVQSPKGMKVTTIFVCCYSANDSDTVLYTEKGLLNTPGIQVEAFSTAVNPLIYLDSPRCFPLKMPYYFASAFSLLSPSV